MIHNSKIEYYLLDNIPVISPKSLLNIYNAQIDPMDMKPNDRKIKYLEFIIEQLSIHKIFELKISKIKKNITINTSLAQYITPFPEFKTNSNVITNLKRNTTDEEPQVATKKRNINL
jgi:hypothetical protein